MPIAITRKLSAAIARCELTHLARQPIDVGLAEEQHAAYERALARLGCRVLSLPADPGLPDSVFVEDAAVVVDELAVIARPGAPSRRPETAAVARALAAHRLLAAIEPPGTLDGGDVLRLGRRLFVGLSERTNQAGLEQLRRLLVPHGYEVEPVRTSGCLHLKSAVTRVTTEGVLLNPAWLEPGAFAGLERIEVDPAEPAAGNALLVGDSVIYPTAFPRTAARLERAGVRLERLDASELAKAEGGVTCCSLILAG